MTPTQSEQFTVFNHMKESPLPINCLKNQRSGSTISDFNSLSQIMGQLSLVNINEENEFEVRIHNWLDDQGIQQVNPIILMEEYYEKKKSNLFTRLNSIQVSCSASSDDNDYQSFSNIENSNRDELNLNQNLVSSESGKNVQFFNRPKISAELNTSGLYRRRSKQLSLVLSPQAPENKIKQFMHQ